MIVKKKREESPTESTRAISKFAFSLKVCSSWGLTEPIEREMENRFAGDVDAEEEETGRDEDAKENAQRSLSVS